MIENSSAGLVMMPGEVTVTVIREDDHQPALARYDVAMGEERQVAVALGWCTIRSGKHRGERAIEVQLDGRRVGELTYLMSRRYAPLLRQFAGGRPGCVALVRRGAKGLEVVLRLPRADADAATLRMTPVAPPTLLPATDPSTEAPKRGYKVAWAVAAGVAAVLVFGAIVGSDDAPPSSSPPSGTTTTEPLPTTTEPEPTTTTVAVKPTTPKPKPTPRVTTPKPAAPPPPKPKPKPKPEPACDENYTGCVPVASDVDCAGGSGDGPAYATGPVQVIGEDVYDLDGNGDGTACE